MELKNLVAQSELYDVYKSDNMAVRVYKKPEYKEKCLYAALTHARVETSLVHSSIKMPIIHEVSVVDGKWCLSMDWIEGKTMAQLIEENPDKADEYIAKMVEIQHEIHQQYMPLLSKLKDKMSRQIKSLAQIDEIKKYELLTRLDSMPKHIKLCHNNFEPKNIIINDDGVFVIDWGSARQGNASADVAKTYLLLSLHQPKLAESYLDKYCEISGTSKGYIQAWLPIVAAAQLDKHIESEKDFLLRWTDVVEY
ncbi:MAG: phosphotransferase [Ruminococcus sp.]|nr:phosphotransferase [Ruminococcus sp.]